MKKLLFILLVGLIAFNVDAQSYKELSTGSTADTLIESTTFSKTFKIAAKETQSVCVQVFVDSISGTPSATATLYQSLDNTNWISTGQTATFSTGVDTTFLLTDTTFYGIYGKIGIVATATAQRSQVKSIMKSFNKR